MFLLNSSVMCLYIVCHTSHFFIFPNDIAHAYGILGGQVPWNCTESNQLLATVTYLTYGIINTYLVIKVLLGLGFLQGILLLVYFVFADLISTEIRLQRNLRYKTLALLRKPESFAKIYRSLQILQRLFIDALGLLVVVCHVMVLKLTVCTQLCLFTKWYETTSPVRCIMLICLIFGNIGWMFSLNLLGKLHTESYKSLELWIGYQNLSRNNHKTTIYIRKFRRSCKPLMFVYKSLYKVRRRTVLIYLKIVIRSTIKSIIAVRQTFN